MSSREFVNSWLWDVEQEVNVIRCELNHGLAFFAVFCWVLNV